MPGRIAPEQGQAAPGDAPLPAILEQARPNASSVPSKTNRRWFWLAGAAVALALGGLGWFRPWVALIPQVATELVAAGPVSRVLAVNGRVASEVSVEVRPLVSGTILSVQVSEGNVVEANTVLAILDPATQAAMVRQALAGLDAALVAQEDAMATLVRTQALGTNAARVVLENAASAAQAAAQEVARMTALLEQAQIQLGRFTIRAPVAGSVLGLTAESGQTVDPTVVLMTVIDLGRLVVETDVDETYATQVRRDQPAALQLAGETEVRPGHVSFVSQRVDPATGGLAIKLASDVPLTAPIGLTVTANITVDDRPAAITVPRAAIIRDDSGSGVYVVTDGTARRRPVTVIDWPATRLIVTEGLAPGDLVICDAAGITDGQAVAAGP